MKIKGSRKAIKHAKVMNIDRWKGSPHRAEPPTPIPPGPRPPIPLETSRKSGPGGAGLEPREPPSPGPEDTQPLQVTPYTVSITTFSPNQKHSTRINTQAHHAGPLGAAEWGWGLGAGAKGWGLRPQPEATAVVGL